MVKPLGKLEVSARQAKNLQQKILVGKQSPFIQFELEEQIEKTKSDKRGGRNPQWDETFSFDILPSHTNLIVKCYNKKSKINFEYIGETVINLATIISKHELDAWFKLKDRDVAAGDVYVEFSFYPTGMPRSMIKSMRSRQAIDTVEEGLSIMSLKDLRNDPRLISAELPISDYNNKVATIPSKEIEPKPMQTLPAISAQIQPPVPTHSPLPNLPHEAHSIKVPPQPQPQPQTNATPQPKNGMVNGNQPADVSDLEGILDEIRSLVDYPYQLPIQPQEPKVGPGALPPMRRKPLPKIPPTPRPTPKTPITETHSPASSNGQNQGNVRNSLPNLPMDHHPIIEHRSHSPAPSSAISDLVLVDPRLPLTSYNYQSSAPSTFASTVVTRNPSLQRRGSADSIQTGFNGYPADDRLDFDPINEVQITMHRQKSTRRRPAEAPGAMQAVSRHQQLHYIPVDPYQTGMHSGFSNGFVEEAIPYAEDVRGRLVYSHHQVDPANHLQYPSASPLGYAPLHLTNRSGYHPLNMRPIVRPRHPVHMPPPAVPYPPQRFAADPALSGYPSPLPYRQPIHSISASQAASMNLQPVHPRPFYTPPPQVRANLYPTSPSPTYHISNNPQLAENGSSSYLGLPDDRPYRS